MDLELGALVAAITGTVIGIGQYIRARTRRIEAATPTKQPPKTLVQVFEDSATIRERLVDARDRASALQAMFLYVHNGGRAVSPTRPLLSTVLGEAHAPSAPPRVGRWSSRALDPQYSAIVKSMLVEGMVHTVTADLPECWLRDAYVTDGVVESLTVLVHGDEHCKAGIWYVSLTFAREVDSNARDVARALAAQVHRVVVDFESEAGEEPYPL